MLMTPYGIARAFESSLSTVRTYSSSLSCELLYYEHILNGNSKNLLRQTELSGQVHILATLSQVSCSLVSLNGKIVFTHPFCLQSIT
jgi:hypothetical protein